MERLKAGDHLLEYEWHGPAPGGRGRQVSREVTACPDCARRAEEHSEGDGPESEGKRGALPFVLPKHAGGRAPPAADAITVIKLG